MKEKLFSWLNRSLDPNTAIGVATYADTVNAVCLKKQSDRWMVHSSHSVNVSEQTDYTAAIVACTNEVSTDICAVNLVIPHYFYQIVQMDKPNLSDEEIIQSLPWTTKDLVDIAPENIVADFIDYPITLTMQSSKMNVLLRRVAVKYAGNRVQSNSAYTYIFKRHNLTIINFIFEYR
ncbi:hypothetical protein [Pseudoalteromonas sp. APC 3691]|uniref:hypothetical protein n=2 Tax=Pseudoalteromonas TaxID=53246 RepID=UPI0025B61BF9|nr:hypothetical protein [Pseudoalteromonas sp. APC 3691]MDN3389474.1 hypothetical protein [Pseudoalteromonas sp. APC 3691]